MKKDERGGEDGVGIPAHLPVNENEISFSYLPLLVLRKCKALMGPRLGAK